MGQIIQLLALMIGWMVKITYSLKMVTTVKTVTLSQTNLEVLKNNNTQHSFL